MTSYSDHVNSDVNAKILILSQHLFADVNLSAVLRNVFGTNVVRMISKRNFIKRQIPDNLKTIT